MAASPPSINGRESTVDADTSLRPVAIGTKGLDDDPVFLWRLDSPG
jgi:hypothetical protein